MLALVILCLVFSLSEAQSQSERSPRNRNYEGSNAIVGGLVGGYDQHLHWNYKLFPARNFLELQVESEVPLARL